MKRRQFVKQLSIGSTGLVLFPSVLASCKPKEAQSYLIKKLRKGVSVFIEENGGTVAFYLNNDSIAVVDTHLPETITKLTAYIEKKKKRSIDIIGNTHHHYDHTSGNFFFKDRNMRIVAHKNVPALQKAQAAKFEILEKQVYASELFEKEWSADIGNENLQAIHYGAAHTGGDAVYHFKNANIVHVGDLVFNNAFPYIDIPGGVDMDNWINTLRRLYKIYDEDTIFVFGHANEPGNVTGKKADLLKMADFLEAEKELVAGKIKKGLSLEKLNKEVTAIPNFEHTKELWEGAMQQNLGAIYQMLNPVEAHAAEPIEN